jgi:hypothetical protein
MARQILDIATADSGTGTPLRTGGDMINDNFQELYGETQLYADFVDAIYRDGTQLNTDLAAWLTAVSGTFSRGGSDHRYINSSGYLVNGSTNALRYTYDSLTQKPIGILLEPARQNLMYYSNVQSHSTWGFANSNITKTVNNTAGITGGTTMATIFETTTANSLHRMWYYNASIAYTSGNIYCFSIYIKQLGSVTDRGLQVAPIAAMGLGTTDVDFVAGSATNGWNMERHRDGIFRLWKTAEATGTGVANVAFFGTKGGATYYTGATTSGYGVENIQYEQVTALTDGPSSYIDNVSTTQNTRSADALAVTVPSGNIYFVYGDGTNTVVAPGAGAYAVPTSSSKYAVRRIATTKPEGEFSGKLLRADLTQADVRGLTNDDGPTFVGLNLTGGIIRMDADGTDIIKINGSTVQLTTGTTIPGSYRGIVMGNNAASGSINFLGFSNSVCIGTDAGKIATTLASSTVINDTAGAFATSISNSDIIGNEAGNLQSTISTCVFIGNFAGRAITAGTASLSVCIGALAGAYNSLASTVCIGASAGYATGQASSGTLTDCVIIGAYAGDNVSGSRTGLVLIGKSVQAPTATTDNFLNIADKIKCDLTTDVIEFGTHSAIAAETVTGYITIKDSSGATRKLAVVS